MVLLCAGDDASAGNGKTIGDLLKVCYGILIHQRLVGNIVWRIETHDSEDQERLASYKKIQLVVSMVLDRCQSTITQSKKGFTNLIEQPPYLSSYAIHSKLRGTARSVLPHARKAPKISNWDRRARR